MKITLILSLAAVAFGLPTPQRGFRGFGNPLGGIASGLANGLRGGLDFGANGLGNLIGIGNDIFGGISSGIAEGIGQSIGDALSGGWGFLDWDFYYRKLADEGVDVSTLPPIETVMAYTDAVRVQLESNEKVEGENKKAEAETPVKE